MIIISVYYFTNFLLGGGGGAGGDGSDGGNGGGIIFTRAHSIERTGGGFFTSFNVNGLSSSGNYGGGKYHLILIIINF